MALVLVLALAGAGWLALAGGGRRSDLARGLSLPEEHARVPEELEPPLVTAPRAPAAGAEESRGEQRIPRAERAEAVPGAEAAALAPTSLGRLVDESTLEPIPEALVATSKLNDWTDANGWFDTGDVLDGLADVLVVNVAPGTATHEIPRERWTRLARGWQIPLAIGPTYRLRFTDAVKRDADGWEGRLVQEAQGPSSWQRLRGGPPPYLRYDEPVRGLDPGAKTWLELRSPDGLLEAKGAVRSLSGVQEVEVACRERAVVRGRVVDAQGAPCADLRVEATCIETGTTERLHAATDKDGSYQLDASEAGTLDLVVLAPLETRPPRLRLQLRRGLVQAPDVVLTGVRAGAIRGTVRCRSGAEPVDATVRLRALDGSGFHQELGVGIGFRTLAEGFVGTKDGVGQRTVERGRIDSKEFAFEDVPAGRFEVSVVTKQGFSCAPAAIQVSAPVKGLVFDCDDRASVRRYRLDVVDAESRAPCSRAEWLARVDVPGGEPVELWTSGEEMLELADGAGFEWWASAPGHRPGHGTSRDFRQDGDAATATCALPAGFGVRLALREWSGSLALLPTGFWTDNAPRNAPKPTWTNTRWESRNLAGAEVLADGVRIAMSDEDGIAELDLPSAPGRIDVRLAGWRVLDSYTFRAGRAGPFPEVEVWLVRE